MKSPIFSNARFDRYHGNYTLTMKLDSNVYGVWKFKVIGGQLNYTGRTERGKADPLTFVEGGRDAWWYERVKK